MQKHVKIFIQKFLIFIKIIKNSKIDFNEINVTKMKYCVYSIFYNSLLNIEKTDCQEENLDVLTYKFLKLIQQDNKVNLFFFAFQKLFEIKYTCIKVN